MKRIFIIVCLVMLCGINISLAGAMDEQKYNEASEVYFAYQDVRVLMTNKITLEKYQDAHTRAYSLYRRYYIKYEGEPTTEALKKLSYTYYAYGLVAEDYVTSGRTDVKKIDSAWERLPKLKSLHRNFWGRYDVDPVFKIIIAYMDEYDKPTWEAIKALKGVE